MADDKKVTVCLGKLFKVVLESNFGTTNIGWCLTHLPTGIALLAEETLLSTPRVGASVQQVFSFTALEVKTTALEFRLIRHTATISDEALGKVTVKLEVKAEESSIDKTNFVEYSENTATVAATENDGDCTQVLKYGYPPYMKYGYPPAPEGGAVPCPPITGPGGTIVAYGFPPPVKYGYPGSFVKYGYPPAGASVDCAVVQDDCGCHVVKYGFPPPVKYGYPGSFVKYGYPLAGASVDCAVVQDDCGCHVVKYGFPPSVKYGYPGCQG
jgi:hypothetical protein